MRNWALSIVVSILPAIAFAFQPTWYQHLTVQEIDPWDNPIWFWTLDSLTGPVRSNDFLNLRYSPRFYGPVITSQEEFRLLNADPHLEIEPQFNAPEFPLPETMPHLRRRADLRIQSRDGQFVTWVRMRGEDGIQFHQYRAGGVPAESLVVQLEGPPENTICYIDGEVRVDGEFAGRMTIYADGDILLADNIHYTGADRLTAAFDEEEMDHLLALVSEQNILVANTVMNGRENGFQRFPADPSRHSIAINGSLIALGESFTFENQNDDWDAYQGPSPDERGYIHHKGSIAQRRRGYTHRSNHQGTGYGRVYGFDERLYLDAPPGLAPGEYPILRDGTFETLRFVIPDTFEIGGIIVNDLFAGPGVVLRITSGRDVSVRGTLTLAGTDANPVTIMRGDGERASEIRVSLEPDDEVSLTHVNWMEGVSGRFTGGSSAVRRSQFGSELSVTGNVVIDSSTFSQALRINSSRICIVERCLLRGGVQVQGGNADVRLMNNTISAGPEAVGVLLVSYASAELNNNIVAFNRRGVVNGAQRVPRLTYNDVVGNWEGDYNNCAPGEGSISENPRFIDLRNGDFRLRPDSPCIDAGDPDAPRDLDGSRADIGAYAFEHPVAVKDDAPQPVEVGLTLHPNPFNGRSFLSASGYKNEPWVMFDIQGRLVAEGRLDQSGGATIIPPTDAASGLYLLAVGSGENRGFVKAVFTP